LLLGAACSFLTAPMYVSRATVRMEPLAEVLPQIEPLALSRTSLSGIVNYPGSRLYAHDLKVMPLIDVLDRMRADIRVEPITSSGANLAISFQYRDPVQAQQTVTRLINRFEEESEKRASGLPQVIGKNALEVIDPPNLPVQSIMRIPLQWFLVLTGSGIGLWIALARRKAHKSGFVAGHFRVAAVLFTLTGFMAGLAVIAADIEISWRDDPRGEEPHNLLGEQYPSSALIRVPGATPEQMTELQRDVLSRTSLSAVIQDPRVAIYRDQLKSEPLDDVIQTMRRHLTVQPSDANPQDLRISFQYRERFRTERTVWFVMDQLDEAARRMRGGQASEPATPPQLANITVIDKPSLPILPVSPDRYRMAGTGGLAGLLAAAIIALIRRRWKPEPELPLDPVSE